MALSSGPKTAFGDFACLVRFPETGKIDARDGGGYAAANDIPYSAGVKYSFRLVVNIPASTYSAYVTPAGGIEQTVGTDFAFRPTAGVVTNLNNWGASWIPLLALAPIPCATSKSSHGSTGVNWTGQRFDFLRRRQRALALVSNGERKFMKATLKMA
jgi:hypothetical protein